MTELKVPNYLKERFESLEAEDGLIDECKYILTLADGWTFLDGGKTIPVVSKREAIEFLKHDVVKGDAQ